MDRSFLLRLAFFYAVVSGPKKKVFENIFVAFRARKYLEVVAFFRVCRGARSLLRCAGVARGRGAAPCTRRRRGRGVGEFGGAGWRAVTAWWLCGAGVGAAGRAGAPRRGAVARPRQGEHRRANVVALSTTVGSRFFEGPWGGAAPRPTKRTWRRAQPAPVRLFFTPVRHSKKNLDFFSRRRIKKLIVDGRLVLAAENKILKWRFLGACAPRRLNLFRKFFRARLA